MPLNLCLRIRLTGQPSQDVVPSAGADQANPAVPSPDEGSAQYLPKAADGNVALEVTDLLYAESEDSLRKMFSDKTIEVVGQYLPGSDPKQFKLVRMFIVCCAADARPLAVPVEVSAPTTAAEMGWVKVVGKATYTKNGDRVHVLLQGRHRRADGSSGRGDALLERSAFNVQQFGVQGAGLLSFRKSKLVTISVDGAMNSRAKRRTLNAER